MNQKSVWITGFVAAFALGLVVSSGAFADTTKSSETLVPRYAETCAHGHNGFNCNLPKYTTDISQLQEATANLEKRVAQLERSR